MSEELKRCWHCEDGGRPQFIGSAPKGGYDRVSCEKCGAEMEGNDEADARAKWNTRAPVRVKPLRFKQVAGVMWKALGDERFAVTQDRTGKFAAYIGGRRIGRYYDDLSAAQDALNAERARLIQEALE